MAGIDSATATQQGDGDEAGDEIRDDAQAAGLARLVDVGEQGRRCASASAVIAPGGAREGEELGEQQDRAAAPP